MHRRIVTGRRTGASRQIPLAVDTNHQSMTKSMTQVSDHSMVEPNRAVHLAAQPGHCPWPPLHTSLFHSNTTIFYRVHSRHISSAAAPSQSLQPPSASRPDLHRTSNRCSRPYRLLHLSLPPSAPPPSGRFHSLTHTHIVPSACSIISISDITQGSKGVPSPRVVHLQTAVSKQQTSIGLQIAGLPPPFC